MRTDRQTSSGPFTHNLNNKRGAARPPLRIKQRETLLLIHCTLPCIASADSVCEFLKMQITLHYTHTYTHTLFSSRHIFRRVTYFYQFTHNNQQNGISHTLTDSAMALSLSISERRWVFNLLGKCVCVCCLFIVC